MSENHAHTDLQMIGYTGYYKIKLLFLTVWT